MKKTMARKIFNTLFYLMLSNTVLNVDFNYSYFVLNRVMYVDIRLSNNIYLSHIIFKTLKRSNLKKWKMHGI